MFVLSFYTFFFFKQKTAYEMRISDWSSDVCSSDLVPRHVPGRSAGRRLQTLWPRSEARPPLGEARHGRSAAPHRRHRKGGRHWQSRLFARQPSGDDRDSPCKGDWHRQRSEERRVGEECGRKCGTRWAQELAKKKKNKN